MPNAELSARAYFVYNEPEKYPELPGAAELEQSRLQEYNKLCNATVKSPDPNTLTGWITEVESVRYWPPVTSIHIVDFILSNGTTTFTTRDTLSTYKTGKGYSYFYNDWLTYHSINSNHQACYKLYTQQQTQQ